MGAPVIGNLTGCELQACGAGFSPYSEPAPSFLALTLPRLRVEEDRRGLCRHVFSSALRPQFEKVEWCFDLNAARGGAGSRTG